MELKDAISLGNTALGFVKCTYAAIYDADRKVLFAIQSKDARYDKETRITQEDGTTDVVWKVPVVKYQAAKTPNDKYVPVSLTEESIRVLESKINSKPPRDGWRLLKLNKDGLIVTIVEEKPGDKLLQVEKDRAATMSKADPDYDYVWRRNDVPIWSDHYTKLIGLIERGEPLYVKPVALEWYPDEAVYTFVDNEGEIRDINVEIEKVKVDLEKARRMVIFAGGATLL